MKEKIDSLIIILHLLDLILICCRLLERVLKILNYSGRETEYAFLLHFDLFKQLTLHIANVMQKKEYAFEIPSINSYCVQSVFHLLTFTSRQKTMIDALFRCFVSLIDRISHCFQLRFTLEIVLSISINYNKPLPW